MTAAGAPSPSLILLVEESGPVRDLVAAELDTAGFRVELVADCTAAFARLQAGAPPDVVVFDCAVPGLRPEAVVGAIRSWHPGIGIVIWSDLLTEAGYATLLAAGAAACLPRADAVLELAPLVHKLIATQRERQGRVTDPALQAHDPADERENARHRYSMPVAVKAPGWGEFAVYYTGDVSRGGLFVRMPAPLPIGGAARVRVGLPDGRVIELDAQVAHVVPPERVPAGRRAGVGLRFLRRTAEERSALAAMVAMLREVVTPPPRVPAAAAPAVDAAADLRAQLAALRQQDFFSMLGLAPGADPADLLRAYRDRARRWHPSRFALAAPAVRAVAAEIGLVLRQARDTLADPGASSEYASRLPRLRRGPRAPRPAPAAPRPAPAAPRPREAAPRPTATAPGWAPSPATAPGPATPTAPGWPVAAAEPGPATPTAPGWPGEAAVPVPVPATPTAPAVAVPAPAAAASSGRWPAPGAAAEPPRRTTGSHPIVTRLEGVLHNPQTLGEIARLPLQPNAPLGDSVRECLLCLLRWLARNRASGLLELERPRPLSIPIIRGRIVLADRETAAVVQAAGAPEVPFVFEPRPENELPGGGKATAGWPFALHLLRTLVHQASLEQLRAELPQDRAPRLRASGAEVVSSLGLSAPERRFVDHADGREATAALIANAGVSPLAAGRVLFLLNVLGALDWDEPVAPDRAGDEVQAIYARLATGNLFDHVGAHYSTAPPRLRASYEAILAGFGPGSPAHARSPEVAAKIIVQARSAWAVLRNRGARRAYRTEQLRIDVRSAANVLLQEAKMSLLRQDEANAREALAAAYDMNPRPEYVATWRNLGANADGTFDPEQADKLTLEQVTAAAAGRGRTS